MTQDNDIHFHFCDESLTERFLTQVSDKALIAALKKVQAGQRRLFRGFRVTKTNLRAPQVQRKLRSELKKFPGLRHVLCIAWLREQADLLTEAMSRINVEKGDDWQQRTRNLLDSKGVERFVSHLAQNLVWGDWPKDDVKILVSILTGAVPNPGPILQVAEEAFKSALENPSEYLDAANESLAKHHSQAGTLAVEISKTEAAISEHEAKRKIIRENLNKDLLKVQGEVKTLLSADDGLNARQKQLKAELVELEQLLDEHRTKKSDLENRQRKLASNAAYEEKKLEEEVRKLQIQAQLLQADSTQMAHQIERSRKTRESIEKAIQAASGKHLSEKFKKLESEQEQEQEQEPAPPVAKRFSGIFSPSLREGLQLIRSSTGTIDPFRKNDRGFTATPVSILALALRLTEVHPPLFVTDEFESVQQELSNVLNDIRDESGRWNDTSLAKLAYWQSLQIQSSADQTSAAEFALAGAFHASRSGESDLSTLLILRLFQVLLNERPETDEVVDPLSKLAECLETLPRNFYQDLTARLSLGQLGCILSDELRAIFDISSPKTRVILKKTLVACFGDCLDIGEHDPSHEILHLIVSSAEQREARLRTACQRWMAQDSLDSIAQSARGTLMAGFAALLPLANKKPRSLVDYFDAKVSSPLSEALRSGTPESCEALASNCQAYLIEQVNRPEWFSAVYLWPAAFHIAEIATEEDLRARRNFRAQLELTLEKQYHPLRETIENRPINLLITNAGNSPARAVKVLVMPAQEDKDTTVTEGEPKADRIEPGETISRTVRVKCSPNTEVCVLDYLMQWTDSSREDRSATGSLKLLSQKKIDWAEIQNPYSLKSIRDPSRLKGRKDNLDVLRRARDAMDSYQITGQRRIGKSSVAQVFQKELSGEAGQVAVYLLWGELGADSVASIFHNICDFVAGALRAKLKDEIPAAPSLADFKGNEGYVANRFFAKIHQRSPNLKIFVIIDDFDELPVTFYESEEGDKLFNILRSLIAKEFVALYLVGGEKVPEILKRQGERLNVMQRCDIDYLQDREGLRELIVEPARDVLQFDPQAAEEIADLTAGNPYYATLICSRLFNEMARARDYFVSLRDIDAAAQSLLEEDTLSNYQHFWRDGVFLPGKLGEQQQYRNAKVLIATARAEIAFGGPIQRSELLKRKDLEPLDREDAEYALNTLVDRKAIIEDERGARIRVPLFSKWLTNTGARAIERSFADAGLEEVPSNISARVKAGDLVAVGADLTYQGQQINEVKISDWLSQFGNRSSQKLAFELLKRLKKEGYFNTAALFSAFKALHNRIVSAAAKESEFAQRKLRRRTTNVYVSYLGRAGKSGASCQYNYRSANKVHSACALDQSGLIERLHFEEEPQLVVFADDIIGTGKTLSSAFVEFKKEATSASIELEHHIFCVACVVGTKEGISEVEGASDGLLDVHVWKEVDANLRAFDPKAGIFEEKKEVVEARRIVEEIGRELEPKHPLGWQGGGLLVVFEHGCPNNTLPIFYKSGKTFRGREWRPLFPR